MKYTFYLLLAALTLSGSTLYGQTQESTWRIGFGINSGLATTDAFKYSLGGDIRVQKDFNKRVSGTFTTGFSHFFEKDHFAGYSEYGSPYNVIPVKLGVKYFLSDGFYVGGEAGAGFAFEQWGTSFLWSPSVGFAFKNGIDLSLKYEDYTRDKATKNIALRMAYSFGGQHLAVKHGVTAVSREVTLGVAVNAGVDIQSNDNNSIGGEVTFYKPITGNLTGTLSSGYTHMARDYYYTYGSMGKDGVVFYENDHTVRNVIPVKAGLRLFLGPVFYLGGEAGVAFGSNKTKSFVYTPSMGLQFRNGIDIGAKFDGYSNRLFKETLSLKLGYHFKL